MPLITLPPCTGAAAVEVGAWGAAMVFDTMATEGGGQRTLVDLAGNCSMVDPAISGEGGWVSVTRMTGTGGVLLVVPEGGVGVEAYREMHEASGGQAFELLSLSKVLLQGSQYPPLEIPLSPL